MGDYMSNVSDTIDTTFDIQQMLFSTNSEEYRSDAPIINMGASQTVNAQSFNLNPVLNTAQNEAIIVSDWSVIRTFTGVGSNVPAYTLTWGKTTADINFPFNNLVDPINAGGRPFADGVALNQQFFTGESSCRIIIPPGQEVFLHASGPSITGVAGVILVNVILKFLRIRL